MKMASGKVCFAQRLPEAIKVISLLLVFGMVGLAQETGNISGTVRSEKGGPVSTARVFITSKTTGQTTSVNTDANGDFTSAPLAASDYALRIEARSYVSKTTIATVTAGATARANILLAPLPVPGVVEMESRRDLPYIINNHLEPLKLEPGGQVVDAGALDPQNVGISSLSLDDTLGREVPRIELDGLSTSNESHGFLTQNVPLGAVQEFHFGGVLAPISDQLYAPGALNVITRSGTDQFHGNIFGFYRNGDVLSASLPGGHAHDWGRQQYGGEVGGAIVPDKLFFFVDVQRNKQDLANPVQLASPFRSSLPFTTLQEPFREFETSDRLDYKASDTIRAFYRFTDDQADDVAPFGRGPSLQAYRTKIHTPANAGGVDFALGNFVHSLRFEYLKYKNEMGLPNGLGPVAPTINIGGGSTSQCESGSLYCVGLSPFATQQAQQSDLQFRYDGSRTWRRHIVHAGANFNRIKVGGFSNLYALAPALSDPGSVALPAGILGSTGDPADPLNYPVQWAFFGNGAGFASERSAFGFPGGGFTDNQIDLYGGDTWKVKPSVTVTYGLHWLRDAGRSNSDLPAVPALDAWGPGLGSKVRQPNLNFAPQLGVSWDASSTGKTIIRAGAGLFYDNSAFLNTALDRPLRVAQGTFLATPAACIGGVPGQIQWPNAGAAGSFVANGAGVVNTNGTVSPTWCGESIGLASPQALALQQAYQTAAAAAGTNANYIGNPGAFAGPYVNGLSLLAPDYQTPRTFQVNAGMQHELWTGLILSLNYERDVTTRTLLGVDVNHGGAADTFNAGNATADRDVAQTANGCLAGAGQVSCMVAKLGPAGALAAYGNAGIGGPAQVTGGAPCPTCAFPGLHPDLGVNVMNFPTGRSVYNAESLSLRQMVTRFSRGVESASFEFSYTHSKHVSQSGDDFLASPATDYANPDRFTGPTALDRTHQVSIGAHFNLQKSLQVSFIGRFLSPLPATLRFQQSSVGAEVLVTDWNGDGTVGDIIPGTNVGSFMRDIKPNDLQKFITNYNSSVPGSTSPETPAGVQLINGGVFSLQELEQLGGVQQTLAAVAPNVAGLSWIKTFDVRVGWVHRWGERFEIRPSVGLFNLFNFANFDLPGNAQSGVLNFGAGSLSPWATALQPQNTVGGSSLSGVTGRLNRASFGTGMYATGTPRSVEWGLKITF